MHREVWRRWTRAMVGKEWKGGRREGSRWSETHEILKERTHFPPSSLKDGRGHPGLPWIAGAGTAMGDWRDSFALPGLQMRHYATPLSRTGKSLQNPTRLLRPDPDAPPEPDKPERRINRAIVSRTIRLITREGHEILTRMEALKRAENLDLDLVEVDGKQDPPVCKLMDFNKERFKDRQREKELKKKQSLRRRLDELKEEPNDLELKAQMALRLLTKGHRVKLVVIPHGNDVLEPKGRDLIIRMMALLQDSSTLETGPRIERQRAWVLVRPASVGTRSVSKKTKGGSSLVERPGDSTISDSEDDKGG